jgi:hypothetical protein
MSLKTLQKIWLAMALLAFSLATNFLGASLGWPFHLSIKTFIEVKSDEMHSLQYSYHGLYIMIAINLAILGLAALHVSRTRGSWPARLPFRFLDVKPETKDGKLIQWIAIALFFVLPLYTLGRLWLIFLTRGFSCLKDGAGAFESRAEIWDIRGLSYWPLDNSFRYAPSDGNCADGPSFSPFLMPMIFTCATILLVYLACKILLELRGGGSHSAN